jgi:proline dehydrogenase
MADCPTLRSLVEVRGWSFARRFVAGRDLDEAVDTIRRLANQGIRSTLSHLGELITDASVARGEVAVFREALDVLHRQNLPCGLSIKPSQMGLMIDPKLAEETYRGVLEAAAVNDQFVRIDMEDHTMTDTTLALVRSLHRDYRNVGIVIQAYLYRSKDDINALNEEKISVRLCKGAYMEPPSVAFPTKREVDQNYFLLKLLLHNGTRPAFGTHDERLIEATIRAAEELPVVAKVAPHANADRENWEFQMLYGVRRDLQANLAKRGYGIRVYVPYGTEWYPYFMRRLAERPANLAFVLKNLHRG